MKRKVMFLNTILLASFALVSSGSAWSSEPVPRAKQQSGKTFKAKNAKKITVSKTNQATVAKSQSGSVEASATSSSTSLPAVLTIAPITAAVALPMAAAAAPAAAPVQTQSVASSSPQPAPVSPYAAANPYLQQPTPANQANSNPYLSGYRAGSTTDPIKNFSSIIDSVQGFLPSLPMEGQSILPKIKTVYPTGEKPLVVLTFKCPTELIGITPLPTKALHELVNLGFDGINRTDLLAFNLQQVCQ